MITQKSIEKDIAQLEVLKVVTRSYAEIASMRLKKMKDSVLVSRDYLNSLKGVFDEVLYSYIKEVKRLAKKSKDGGKLTFLSHNGRTVAVFLSANSRLYGDLILRTYDLFVNDIKSKDVEVTIIGKHGKALFEEHFPDRSFTYFDFADIGIDKEGLNPITDHLVQYEKIIFYYPEFQNAVRQVPKMYALNSGTVFDPTIEGKEKKSYLFEPNLESILLFFETQIFTFLMEQTIEESQLAKFASRVFSMDHAYQLTKEELKKSKLQKLQFVHKLINKKQTQLMSSMSLWKF